MTPPDYFTVSYSINAWMHTDDPVDTAKARLEWQSLKETYDRLGWPVELTTPAPGLADMVFATDCGLVLDGKVLLGRFRYPERQPETEQYHTWFAAHGFPEVHQSTHYLEGGDNLACGNKIFAGHGFRSDPAAADELRQYFGREVVPLKLIDPLLYHLDTALGVLSAEAVACYLPAFDAASQARLRAAVPRLIEVTRDEALSFALNLVSDGQTIITSDESPSLLQKYTDGGFQVIALPISEFKKSGGGVHCLTLELG